MARYLETSNGAIDAEWVLKPQSEAWSMGEVTEHVTFTNRGINSLLSGRLRPLADVESVALRDDEISPRMFDGAGDPPNVGVPTGSWTDRVPALDKFEASMLTLVEWTSVKDADLRARAYEHPVFGLMDGVQWLLFAAAHTERHRADLTELRRLASEGRQRGT